MRLSIAAVGRLKQGPERDLAERYAKRAADAGRQLRFAPIDVIEVRESRSRDVGKRMIEESIALANTVPDGASIIVLDPRGESLGSDALAARLRRWQDGGRPAVTFLIGGPDGLAASLFERAELRLAFGIATWPHQLVRIMLLEQLYRTMTILAGHPYHRA
ncbi:MAG: 23S rRNA (pseudouridine(1915)-N(3))-methyltransferase RlmH [Rhizobiales bacterium]|nr:23S rRNA (pseudouridine(1915)-N(3))-methyltransferase RlmH [Hyphomicrobiales bacterium]